VPSLVRINVTPMKGAALLHPERVHLGRSGIAGNRRFFLVTPDGGLFSGGDHGPLVRIVATIVEQDLRLAFPDGALAQGRADDLGEPLDIDFYGRHVPARAVRGPFDASLTAFVGRPVRLVRADRETDGVDVEPLTLVSLASVRDLARRGGRAELDAAHFRMNLELEGTSPYEEDGWEGARLRIGGATLSILGQVPRCVVTTQSPATGEKDWDTLTQIAKYRPRIHGDGGLPFGMYAAVLAPGEVAVGDEVVLLG